MPAGAALAERSFLRSVGEPGSLVIKGEVEFRFKSVDSKPMCSALLTGLPAMQWPIEKISSQSVSQSVSSSDGLLR